MPTCSPFFKNGETIYHDRVTYSAWSYITALVFSRYTVLYKRLLTPSLFTDEAEKQ